MKIVIVTAICCLTASIASAQATRKSEKPVNFVAAKPQEVPSDIKMSPTLGAQPPAGAVVLFDGKNLDAWAKKAGKDWLKEDGPAKWKLTGDGAVEVVPESDCIITHQKFGDCHLHVEFRTLGEPTNSGVFLEDRYEVNINESYGKTEGTPNGGFDNCTDKVLPSARASLPPLAWQT